MRLLGFVIVALIFLAAFAASERKRQNDGLPLVSADFPICVSVDPGPIRPRRHDVFHPKANAELS